jgi:hypothetical protein
MRKLLLFSIGIAMSISIMAQEETKQKEVGLVFNSLNSFGLSYKTGSNTSLWRFNTLLISGNNTDYNADSLDRNQSNFGFSISFGKEYRKPLVENLELRYGADLSFRYNKNSNIENDISIMNYDSEFERTTYSPGVKLVFGLNYVFKNKLIIGAEILPYFSYTIGTETEDPRYDNQDVETKTDISGFSFGLSNQSVLVSLAYRF